MSAFGSGSQLTCLELVELISDYLEDCMSPHERARFDEHLAACDGCATYLEQMRQTIKLTGALRDDSIPPAARDELLAAFRDWRTR